MIPLSAKSSINPGQGNETSVLLHLTLLEDVMLMAKQIKHALCSDQCRKFFEDDSLMQLVFLR